MFEPFFTPEGSRGDGLDLPSVYGVVKQSGGFVWVTSEVSEGTRITILLPPIAVEEARPDVHAPSARSRPTCCSSRTTKKCVSCSSTC